MKKKIIIFGAVILVLVVGMIYNQSNEKTMVEIFEIKEATNLNSFIEETAIVKARNQQEIYSSNQGELVKILVEEGQLVSENTILGSLDEKNIKLQLDQLEANKKELDALYNETLKPADWQTIQTARTNLEISETNFKKSEEDYLNSQKLYQAGAINLNEFNEDKTSYEIQKKNVDIAKSQLSLSQKKVSKNIGIQIKSQIEALEKNKAILQNDLAKYSFISNINGIITEVIYKEGQYLQPGMKLFEITDLNSIYLEVEVLASDVKQLQLGAKVIIDDSDLEIKQNGKIVFISPKAYSKISDLGIDQKRVKVEVELNETNSNLKLNYEVITKLIVAERQNIIAIPNSAIFEIEDEPHVFIIENEIAKLKKLEIGIEGEEQTEIINGLKKGDKIVDSPSDELDDGVKIEKAK